MEVKALVGSGVFEQTDIKQFIENLSIEQLIKILNRAIELNLEKDLINLLANEIHKQFLKPDSDGLSDYKNHGVPLIFV